MKLGVAKAVRYGRAALLTIGLAAAAHNAQAQVVPDDVPEVQTGLDLPDNLQIFGDANPDVRKPTAIVNDVVVTGTDVDQRVALVLGLRGIKVNADEMKQLRLQVLRLLIDETLQIQEARANDIVITPRELDTSFATISRRFGRSPEEMRAWLTSIGSSEASFRRQIEGELAWNRLLRRTVDISVSEAEVKSIIDRMQESKGTEEYHVYEIYNNATPERNNEVYGAQQRMMQQMNQGAPFEYFASNFSEATTRTVGGDLGWVRVGMLPDPLAKVVSDMQVGQVVGPVQVPGGYSIIYLADKRAILTADPRDAKLSLRQMTITFPAGTTQAQASARANEFLTATRSLQGCGDVPRVAQATGAQVVDDDTKRVRDLPPPLQEMVIKLSIGEATQPFGSLEDGVRVLVLCGRDEASDPFLPSVEQIQERLEEQRVNLRAQRILRDLRRDALIEYR